MTARGEIKIRLGPDLYPMRPTFDAAAAIETALDTSIAGVYLAHRMGQLQLAELAEIVRAGMIAGGAEGVQAEAVAKRLFEAGPASDAVRRPVGLYLLELGWSPEDREKKRAAEWPEAVAEETASGEAPRKHSAKRPPSGRS